MSNNIPVTIDNLSKEIKKNYEQMLTLYPDIHIIDRVNDSSSFWDVFKESLFQYAEGVLLIDRFYTGKNIHKEIKSIEDIHENLLKEKEAIAQLLKNNTISDEESKQLLFLIDEINRQLETSDLEEKGAEIAYYSNPKIYVKNNHLLMKLSGYTDEALHVATTLASTFIITFLRNICHTQETNFFLDIERIPSDDYIDLVVIVKK